MRFSPVNEASGHPASGRTDASGRYALQTVLGRAGAGTTPGTYKVVISRVELVNTNQMELQIEGPPRPMQRPVERMPAKTANFNTTDLEVTVENRRENVFDFSLTSP